MQLMTILGILFLFRHPFCLETLKYEFIKMKAYYLMALFQCLCEGLSIEHPEKINILLFQVYLKDNSFDCTRY